MKKLLLILALVCVVALCLTATVACKDPEPPKGSIQLRSEPTQALEVGQRMEIVYSLKNVELASGEFKEDKVTISSSDESVVVVDDWAKVDAVGKGTAVVTIALKSDPSTKVQVTFNVTKTFFMQTNGYKNGNVEFNEDNGVVTVKDGQAQVLVNECSEYWYFTALVNRTGYAGSDNIGCWGVGSFQVNNLWPIGDNMFWFMLGNRGGSQQQVMVRYGGWRYSGINGQLDTPIDNAQHNIFNGVKLTIARLGTRHFMIADFGNGDVVKKMVDVPDYAGVPTYPGVFGQNQKLTIMDYEAVVGEEEVISKIADFQVAESVNIHAIDNRLLPGFNYQLSAEVGPYDAVDTRVAWSLKQAVSGVTLDENGVLTIAANATGSFTVVATSKSNNEVADEQEFVISTPSTATGGVLEDKIFATAQGGVTKADDTFVVSAGDGYLPINVVGTKWFARFEISGVLGSGSVGIMAETGGYMNYAIIEALANNSNTLNYGVFGKTESTVYATPGSSFSNVELGLIRDGNTYYVLSAGRIIRTFAADMVASRPVVFTKGVTGTISGIAYSQDANQIDAIIAGYKYIVGGYVKVTGENDYRLASHLFSGPADINWPPVNDYENGIKLNGTMADSYSIEFTMSNFKPVAMSNGQYDGKVLVYLRSESTTSSVQFVFKGTPGAMTLKVCPNLNDSTWDEYSIPGISATGSIKVKVVKTLNKVELYLNDTLVLADHASLNNNGLWAPGMQCTPGVGSFQMGVDINDLVITEIE